MGSSNDPGRKVPEFRQGDVVQTDEGIGEVVELSWDEYRERWPRLSRRDYESGIRVRYPGGGINGWQPGDISLISCASSAHDWQAATEHDQRCARCGRFPNEQHVFPDTILRPGDELEAGMRYRVVKVGDGQNALGVYVCDVVPIGTIVTAVRYCESPPDEGHWVLRNRRCETLAFAKRFVEAVEAVDDKP